MNATRANLVLRHIRGLAEPAGDDACLLERFTAGRDEGAFAELLRRHGPMVWGVCRRVLHNAHDADDAFQATFLVLARKAASITRRECLGSWLYQVACNIARKARASAAARQRREQRAGRCETSADLLAEVTGRELVAILDEELSALSRRCREPLVLCYLQGLTRDEAARRLGCSESTLKRRLELGKGYLRNRLARRGLTLPAALLTVGVTGSAVPASLAAATVRAAATTSTRVAELGCGSLRTLTAVRFKAAGALLVAVTLVAMGVGLLARPAPADAGDEKPKEALKDDKSPQPKPADAAGSKTTAITGRVVDPDGKPVANAAVIVTARQGVLLSNWEGWATLRNEVLTEAAADRDGRFQITLARTDPNMTVRQLRVVALAPGFGLGWKAIDPNAERSDVEVRLSAVQPVRGCLVGIQGEPAAGVAVHVVRVTRKPGKGEREEDAALRLPESLKPVTTTTDDKGRFGFDGFGPDVKLELEIRDPRYERKDEWFVSTADKKVCENLSRVLGPGKMAEGRVVYADTGKPVPHARLRFANPIVEATADEQGRFKVSLFPSDDVGVHAYPLPGEPYLNTFVPIGFPRGVVRREVEVRLPRGVLVRGKVTEAGGKPVTGAYVSHGNVRDTHAVTKADGSYQLGVPAGAGYLLVTHPSNEFIPQVIGSAGGGLGEPITDPKPIGDPAYHHAVVPVKIKTGDSETEVNLTLRRGVTVKGRLVGTDGKPVAHAVQFVSGHRPPAEKTMHPTHVRDGSFEVRGLDPDRPYRMLFLDHPHRISSLMTVESLKSFGQLWLRPLLGPENKHGAVVEFVPKKVEGELTVKLEPCASAKVRFVDDKGKPLAGHAPWLQLVVTDGPPIHKALEAKTLAAEVVTLTGRYGGGHADDLVTDAEGYATFQGLIPGATYRLKKTRSEPNNEVLSDFSVPAGKTLEMEIVVK